MSDNPYAGRADYTFWRRSVSRIERHLVDPVVEPRFVIAPDARVATAGSCFAQHISRRLREIGFNYFVPEAGHDLPPAERERRHYGVFSARFGNIYTVAQLLALFEEAFPKPAARRAALGLRWRKPTPYVVHERAWRRPDGRLVDPYRPQVEPDGFTDVEGVIAERERHLVMVRRMFLEADVFVFTLGLTEAWRSKADGAIFPIAPGVVAGRYDPAAHEAVNFRVDQIEADLARFLDRLKEVNPGVRVLLTVSPVPLIATFEDRHVLCSTSYSKAALRVAADTAVRAYDWVDYFPSYEIITGNFSGGLYYEDDFREVHRAGVDHVMRCFVDHYVERGARPAAAVRAAMPQDDRPSQPNVSGIVCDEEVIAAIRGR